MITRIKIKTPKGQARKTAKKLKWFLLGSGVKHKAYYNKEDNEIYWEIEAPVKKILNINRNVFYFDQMMRGVLDHKLVKRAFREKLTPDQEEELRSMLLNQTQLEIIKEATAQEIIEHNKSFWQRIKETFSRAEI